ncbi:hypothetical protein HMPREF1544_02133 [Mucor circinelloides 1006PhL]|uniref:Uncharacterized protein n=1 Tax=Mucor circinelloides f. circinelloides (strain 1006PhL) TaxID=1220926 RepID=S2JM59_MUCC1|nr:hypothetical protein HMPREF1544_02133 [Mucor circinelloides 1006PhL]
MSIAIFDAESNAKMESCIELLNYLQLDDPIFIAEKKLIVDICRTLNDYIFDDCGLKVLQKSESCYRSYLFDKCMMATTKYLRNINHNVTFLPGEIELNAMTLQLKQKGMNDGRYKDTDVWYSREIEIPNCNFAITIVNDLSAIEILLTEVSSVYGSAEAGKVSFDHYKAMFGMLAMIRTVAQSYDKASFSTFTKLKIHFLHAHGNSIRHWSMSTQSPDIYIMTKEQRIACEETLSVLKELKQEHETILRSKGKKPQKLCNIINPIIIRLNEGKHANIVAEHDPMSVPNSPMHD